MSIIVLTTVVLITFASYFYNNSRPSKYYWETKLDSLMPIIPVFIIPYLLHIPQLIFTYFILLPTDHIYGFLVTLATFGVLTNIFWYFIPNGVARTNVTGKGLFIWLINRTYEHDGDTNGFPSGHVGHAIICTYFLVAAFPMYIYLWLTIGILISISTVLVKQHYVVDILGGILFTLVSSLIYGLVG